MPAAARGSLDQSGLDAKSIVFSVSTDISLSGDVASQWLIVTESSLAVLQSPVADEVLLSADWSEIDEVRTVSGVGSGRLQIRRGETWSDLLRYSNALATRFHKLSRQLNLAANAELVDAELFAFTSTQLDPPHCDHCGLRLPESIDPDADACPRCMQHGRILSRLWELITPHRNGAIVLCLLTIFGVAAELVPPKLQQYMVDQILTNNGQPMPATESMKDFHTALLVVVLALALSRLMLSVVGFIKGRVATAIGVGLTSRLRREMVTKLNSLSVAYYDRHNTGSIISRVSHDSEALHGLMHQFTGGFLLQAVKLFGVGIMLVLINPKLAMFTLIPVPFVLLGSWVFWNHVYPRYYRLRDASAKQMQALNGMLHGIRVVKAFGQEDNEIDRYQAANDRLTKWRLWVDVTNSGYAAAMQIVFSLGGLIVWYVGGLDVIGNEMTLGELIAFLAYLAMFYAPLNALSSFTTWMTSFLSGSKRVLELLDTPATLRESDNAVSMDETKGAIEFKNVTFGYDPNQPVLKDVSFAVKPGEMIGIVGRSGSGKTTIVNLLSRFYDVQEGSITIDGTDVREIVTRDLRKNVGIVLQDSFLFGGTIAKNLTYGQPNTTVRHALSAAKAAGAHDFICGKPLAYDTWLGQRGAGLSGGEKQRLSIARTLLYDPNILILDEATSNIDAESEKLIQDALERLTTGRSTVAIAHRLSTLRNADRILVFDHGDLIEEGSHAELIDADGKYARMVKIQMQVSKSPNVDRLLDASETESLVDESKEKPDGDLKQTDIRWLESADVTFSNDDRGVVSMVVDGDEIHEGLFCIRVFPAQYPDQYISVRSWNENGEEVEIGVIENLADLNPWNREIVEDSLNRHYLIREIQRVYKADLSHGYLDLDVETDSGRETLTMRWTASQTMAFSENGKLIIDTEDNRYLVRDIAALPKPDRERFQQYIYW
jgi:ATP-binding cassette subfamily B protein